MIEPDESVRQAARTAVHRDPLPAAVRVLAGLRQFLERGVQVGRNEQVQASVAVVVDPGAAGAVPHIALAKTGFLRDVGEGAVAVVAIQHVLSIVGDEQIVEAVVVEVADGDRRRPAGLRQASLVRDIRERAVAVVLVEPVRRPRWRPLEAGAVEDEEILPAVVVVIDECGAAADDLDDVALGVDPAIDDRRGQAGLLCHIGEPGVERTA